MTYKEWAKLLKNERLPTALVDLHAFDQNIKKVAEVVKSGREKYPSVRIATKSLRVPALIQRVLDFGSPFQGLMTYSAEESVFLAAEGFDDFLLAYPPSSDLDINLIANLHESGKKVRVVVDSTEGVERLSKNLRSSSQPLELLLEVDVALRLFGLCFGVERSPIRTAAQVLEFIQALKRYPNVKLVGLMVYEAQVAGLGDRSPFKMWMNPFKHWIRKISIGQVAKTRIQLAKTLKEAGVSIEVFNGGGTGSLSVCAHEQVLTEVTSGSAFLCPHLFDYYSNIQLSPACFFALGIARFPKPNIATCSGGGYIASGEPGWDKVPVPYLPEGSKLVAFEGCGEVQTPVVLKPGLHLSQGEPILFRHAKAGELAERFEEYLLVKKSDDGGEITERVKTYRGLGQCFF